MFEEMKSVEPVESQRRQISEVNIDYSNTSSEEEVNIREAQPMIQSTIV